MTTATSTPEVSRPLGNLVLTGAMWTGIARVTTQILSFASVAVVARRVAPEAYGLMNMAQIAIYIISLMRDIGVGSAVVQRPQVNDRFLSSVFWVTAALGAIASVICYVAAPLAALFYREPMVTSLLKALSISFFLTNITTVHQALLARRMDFRTLTYIEVGSLASGQLAAIAMALHGAGVWSLVAATLTNAVVSTAAFILLTPWRPQLQFSRDEVRSMSKFGMNLSAFNFMNFFARNADNALIGRYLGVTPLGYYQFAYQMMLYPVQSIAHLLGRVVFPALTQMQDDHARFRAAYLRSCSAIAFLAFPMMSGVAILAQEFVRLWLGPQWMPAALLVTILAPIGMIQCITTTTGQIYMAKARTDTMLHTGVWFSAIIVASFAVGLRWGALGVATSYAITFAIIAIPMLKIPFSLIDLRLRDLLSSLQSILLCTAVMALVVFALRRGMLHWTANPAYVTIACATAGAVVYLGLALLLRVSVIDDLLTMIRNRRASSATDAA